jgi:hypothetical protein
MNMKRLAIALAFKLARLALRGPRRRIQPGSNRQKRHQLHLQADGCAVDGKFSRFSSQLNFDPAKPTAAKASFDVELASVDTGAPEGDDEVAGKPWFNTKAFPDRPLCFRQRQGARRQPLRSRRPS